jgi:hypothetical protein
MSNLVLISEGQDEQDRIKQILSKAGSLTASLTATPTTVAAVAGAVPAGGTGAAAGAWDTSANRDTAITTITEIKTQLNALLTELRARKIIG